MNDAAGGHAEHRRDPVGPGHADLDAVRMDAPERVEVRVVLAALAVVAAGGDLADLDHPHLRQRVDHARVDVLAGDVDHLGVRG